MTEMEQANLRLPVGSKDVMTRLARVLREDPNFAHRITRFLDEQSNPEIGGILERRIERLEEQMADLLSGHLQPGAVPSAARPPKEPIPAWTMGRGRARRLTSDGEAELERLVREGLGDSAIARELGISPYAVTSRRARIKSHDGS